MSAGLASVVSNAQPAQVGCRLNPCAKVPGVGHAGVVDLERLEADAFLERELNVGVVQLKTRLFSAVGRRWTRVALSVCTGVEANSLTDVAPGGRSGFAVIVVEVDVVRIVLPRRMRGEMDKIRSVVLDAVVGCDFLGHFLIGSEVGNTLAGFGA